jgi:hypothetical protein
MIGARARGNEVTHYHLGFAQAKEEGSTMRRQRLATALLALTAIGGVSTTTRAEGPLPPSRGEPRHERLFDQLDDARINRDLLELEVAADRAQIESMMRILRESELTSIQGFSHGPVIGGMSPDEREANLQRYRKKLDQVCREFMVKSKELARERRRVAELETELGLLSAVAPLLPGRAPARGEHLRPDAERLLDLLRKGIDAWSRDPAPTPEERPTPDTRSTPERAPEEDSWKDAERLLGLIRKGIEAWRRP